MKKGDLGFFYHTGDEKRIVGIVEVIAEYKPDPTDETGKFGLVDVKAVKDVPNARDGWRRVKADPKLAQMVLGARSPPLRPAGDRRGVEAHLQAGRGESSRQACKKLEICILPEERVPADQGQIFRKSLRDHHAIERIAMMKRQAPQACDVRKSDRQNPHCGIRAERVRARQARGRRYP